jgi:TRAP transporter TAXI family solute receptor
MRWLLISTSILLVSCATEPAVPPGPASTAVPVVYSLGTGAKGGGFYPYGEAAIKLLSEQTPLRFSNLETAGSNENLRLLESGKLAVALVNMGPAYEAHTATGSFAGAPRFHNLRALLPMYETPFHFAVPKGSAVLRVRDLAGRRVAVGPAKGPAEEFFRGLIAELGISVSMVNGSPADQASQLQAGSVDAFWYGAGVPIPAFKTLADAGRVDVRGLDEEALAAFLKRFPYLARYSIPAGTYLGQGAPLQSAAVWNFVLAHPSLPDSAAYAITKTLLENTDALASVYAAARATRAENAPANGFLPFHPGASRYYRERSVSLPSR